eukprot:TRINITY_DN21765_c0_g1_i1.p1 TRINITY_DN21765_c0_g1~~TRINITY_DN21765_c0_g1_i1.p1  ORF type:complete len:331 (-),score=42.41 TRINITY_DN21765_c0_g1_i1:343-1335(-)
MRKLVFIILLAISLVSCKDKAKINAESSIDIPVNSEIKGKADIVFRSNPIAEDHRTVITEKYNELEVNFASYYVITTWGCGSGCVTGVMVDIRDGIVYSLPEDKEWGGNGTYIDSKKESQILVTVAVAQSPSREIEEIRKSWEWNEDLKKFKFIKEETVIEEQKIVFQKNLSLQNITFEIKASGEGSIQQLSIQPEGLEIDNQKITLELEGQVTNAEIEDLNLDGFPEILIYTVSAGSGSYGNVIGYSVNNGKSISQIYFPEISENKEASSGYMGHDEFAVIETSLARRFPVYKYGDTNTNPTGGTRQIEYKLKDGEASRLFVINKISEF